MKVEIKRKVVGRDKSEAGNHITRKWGINGRVRLGPTGRKAIIEYEVWARTRSSAVVGVKQHEQGHVEYFEDRLTNEGALDYRKFAEGNTWQMEVDAWLRGLDAPFPLKMGQMALDCLWTYKVGTRTSMEEWETAKSTLADSCENPGALLRYEPEPIPPGEEGQTGPGVEIDEDMDEEGLPYEDYDPDEGMPRPPVPEGNGVSERDKWLESPEALPWLKTGHSGKLKKALDDAGHSPYGPLPMVPAEIFKNAGGRWERYGG